MRTLTNAFLRRVTFSASNRLLDYHPASTLAFAHYSSKTIAGPATDLLHKQPTHTWAPLNHDAIAHAPWILSASSGSLSRNRTSKLNPTSASDGNWSHNLARFRSDALPTELSCLKLWYYVRLWFRMHVKVW